MISQKSFVVDAAKTREDLEELADNLKLDTDDKLVEICRESAPAPISPEIKA